MAKKKTTLVRYRDRDTGRFVSKKTWKRSRAHDGIRYKREFYRAPIREEEIEEIIEDEEEEEEEEYSEEEEVEYGGAFDSPKKK